MIDRVRLHHLLRLGDRAQTLEPGKLAVVAVAQVSDDAESELIAMCLHPLEYGAGELAVVGDEHAVEILPRAMPPFHDESHERAPGDREEHRADQEDAEGGARVEDVARSGPHPEQHAG